MAKKTKEVKIDDLKYCFISDKTISIWWEIVQANKVFCIEQNQAFKLRQSIFYKKWVIKDVENEAK